MNISFCIPHHAARTTHEAHLHTRATTGAPPYEYEMEVKEKFIACCYSGRTGVHKYASVTFALLVSFFFWEGGLAARRYVGLVFHYHYYYIPLHVMPPSPPLFLVLYIPQESAQSRPITASLFLFSSRPFFLVSLCWHSGRAVSVAGKGKKHAYKRAYNGNGHNLSKNEDRGVRDTVVVDNSYDAGGKMG